MDTHGEVFSPLLARGRDRLETFESDRSLRAIQISYSLGDAIDWKRIIDSTASSYADVSYSLGDAIDWKLPLVITDSPHKIIP